MIKYLAVFQFFMLSFVSFDQFAPAAGQQGTTAIYKDSSIFINWASNVINFSPGPENISDPQSMLVSSGVPDNALNIAEGNSFDVISLGDSGLITLSFPYPISNGFGHDFAVFENSFSDNYLEFAFVEVSTNGIDFVRFRSTSNVPIIVQTGPFDNTDPTLVNNLAGKYIQGYGTPFDLDELVDSSIINTDSINFIKIVDVIGSIDPAYGSPDANGNLINDPFPSPFPSSGFDLDAVGVIHQNNPLGFSKTKQLDILVYPNPVENYLNVSVFVTESVRYHIYDLSGRLMLSGKLEISNSINTENLSNGQYLLKVISGDLSNTSLISIQK